MKDIYIPYTLPIELEQAFNNCNKCVVYGANGFQTALTIEWLRSYNKKVVALIDRNPDLIGQKIMDIEVVAPEMLPIADTFVVIAVAFTFRDVKKSLDSKGIQSATFYQLFDYYEKEQLAGIRTLFEDTESLSVFDEVLYHRTGSAFSKFSSYRPIREQYFDFFNLTSGLTLVDIGANVGDSVERYLQTALSVKRIWAFEPDTRLFQAMQKRFNRLVDEYALDDNTLVAINAACGDEKKQLTLYGDVSGSTKLDSPSGFGEIVNVLTIDEYFNNTHFDYLKMDIEGGEQKALLGGQDTIKRIKPRLAVCVYHKASDIIEIPMLLKSLVPSYRFALRHYGEHRLEDTVLYAYNEEE